MDIQIFRKQVSWQSSSDVKQICQPLFEYCNLNYFDYARSYPDGSAIILISDQVWFENFFRKQYFLGPTILNVGIHLWSSYMPKMEFDLKNFNHNYALTVVKEEKEYIEQYDFAAPVDNNGAINFYLNNMELLERFMLYFKEKADELIKLSEAGRIVLPPKMIGIKKEADFNKEGFLKSLQANELNFLFNKNQEVKLTQCFAPFLVDKLFFSPRETDCIKHLLLGKTAREIGDTLFVSRRTVETHMENIKNKLGCNKKSEVIINLFKQGFAERLFPEIV